MTTRLLSVLFSDLKVVTSWSLQKLNVLSASNPSPASQFKDCQNEHLQVKVLG